MELSENTGKWSLWLIMSLMISVSHGASSIMIKTNDIQFTCVYWLVFSCFDPDIFESCGWE